MAQYFAAVEASHPLKLSFFFCRLGLSELVQRSVIFKSAWYKYLKKWWLLSLSLLTKVHNPSPTSRV